MRSNVVRLPSAKGATRRAKTKSKPKPLAAVQAAKPPEAAKQARRTFTRKNGVALVLPSGTARATAQSVTVAATAEDGAMELALAEASVSFDPALQAAHGLRNMEGYSADQGPGLNELACVLERKCAAVRAGDMSGPEDMLLIQAHALDALFGKMIRKASANMAEYPEAFERYMRFALKAQSQGRATLETLALMKNPPNVLFARQANIAGGHQQVNNGPQALPHAHAGEKQIPTNKLLEGAGIGGERLDLGATTAAGGVNQGLEAVGAIHRPKDRSGEGDR